MASTGGMLTSNTELLRRSEVWSSTIKEILKDELQAQKYVDWLTEFPDGDQFNIPSIGQTQVDDYSENEPITYRPFDTGEFNFVVDQYKSAGTYISKKALQDGFYMSQLESKFMPEMERAMMVDVENKIMNLQAKQTAGDANAINGKSHRFAGGLGGKLELTDFAYMKLALKVANVPMTNLVAIVEPSVAYYAETLTNLVSVADNPRWEGIVNDGITTGMRFVKNIYGWDVYESNYTADVASETLNEADGTSTAVTNAKANLFFSAAPSVTPFVGVWRQMPEFDSEYNKDFQRFETVMTARYGVDLYRPENFGVVVAEEHI